MLRAIAYFLAPIAIGVLLIPFAIWAAFGFPDGDSHGLWIPVMFAGSIGFPAGLLVGTVCAVICLIRKHRTNRKATKEAIDSVAAVGPVNVFEKTK